MVKKSLSRLILSQLTKFLFAFITTFSISVQISYSQDTVMTVPPITGNNGQSGVTFEVEAIQEINLTGLMNIFNAATTSASLWMRTGGVEHAPGSANITAANGWTQVISNAPVIGANGNTPVLMDFGIQQINLQPNTRYGFFIDGQTRYQTGTASDPPFVTDGTATVHIEDAASYGGGIPNPTFNPRRFAGGIIYEALPSAMNDAGVVSIDEPTTGCAGEQNVIVTIENAGINIINNVTVNWEVGGNLQPPFQYNQSLDTANGSGPNTAQIVLGSYNFQNPNDAHIKVWTSDPNNMPDTVNMNDTVEAEVNINFAVVQVVSSLSPTCPDVENGQAVVTSLGGIPPFSYYWSTGDTGSNVSSLPAGESEVLLVDGIGCRDSAIVDLPAPDSLLLSLEAGGVTCGGINNGFAQLNVTGGTPPYSFNWSNGLKRQNIDNIPPGNYSVTVTDDDGCTQMKSVEIQQVPILRSQVDSLKPAMCTENIGSASLSGSGGLAPLSFQWPGGLTGRTQTGLSGGTYEVTVVDDAGCENIMNVHIPEVELGVTFDRPTLFADLDNALYQWYDCDNDILISGETFQNFTPESPGNYAVIVTYENCTDTSGCKYIAYTSAENQIADNRKVKIYPNPNNGQFNIAFDGKSGMAQLEIFDLNGRLIKSREIQNQGNGYVFQVHENLASGMYLIKINQEDNSSLHRVVVR